VAKTFYGYVDRRDQNQVDWNGLASEASKSLKDIYDSREERKKELDEINRSLVSATNEVEMGQNQTFNQFVLDGSAQTKEFLLMQNRLLKKGLLNPNDYSKAMQTVKDDWSSFSTSTKKFNQVYDEAFKRLNDGTMAMEEAFKKEGLFKFGNVQNKGVYVSPTDGRLYLAEKDEKGRLITDPDKLINVASLNDMMNEKVEKFNVVEQVSKGASKMADIVRVLRKNNVLTLKDARQNAMYKKSKEDFISSLIANPKNAASVLADYLGGYEFTYDKSKSGGNVILLEKDGSGIGQPRLTKEQESKVRETLDAAFETQMEALETPMPVFAPQRANDTGGREEAGIVSNLGKIYFGNQNDVRAALSFFQGLRPDIVDMKRTESELVITNNDGQLIRIPFVDESGQVLTQQQFIESAINQITPGVKDIRKAMRDSGLDLSRPFNPSGSAEFKVESAGSQKPLSQRLTIGSDNKPSTVANLISAVDPDADNAADIQSIIQAVDPRITITPISNRLKKDQIEIYMNGNLFKTIDYDDKKDNAILLQVLDEASRTNTAQAQSSGGLMSKY
jgi:hypothetical protein